MSITAGFVLNNHYEIVQRLGSGGFGQTYLAKDCLSLHLYVLKELAPQVQDPTALQKAQELFEREARILSSLQHEQIPSFHQLLRSSIDGKEALFLVQDYIKGQSYWELLQQRNPNAFSETEIIQLLLKLLPVLEYIHSQNVIHRDISPDNIMQRQDDSLPMLIDFGSVKEEAAQVISRITHQPFVTCIGKKGYAPEEQMMRGTAYPSSDLYSLAVTAVVLLTGTPPSELYNHDRRTWHWQDRVSVSSELATILNKMLSYHPRDRYSSAREVRHAIESLNTTIPQPQPPQPNPNHNSPISQTLSTMRTLVVAPGTSFRNIASGNSSAPIVSQISAAISRIGTFVVPSHPPSTGEVTENNTSSPTTFRFPYWRVLGMGICAAILPGFLIFAALKANIFAPSPPIISEPEQKKQIEIQQRCQASEIGEGACFERIDKAFWSQHPEIENRQLNNTDTHKDLREEYYKVADEVLAELE